MNEIRIMALLLQKLELIGKEVDESENKVNGAPDPKKKKQTRTKRMIGKTLENS